MCRQFSGHLFTGCLIILFFSSGVFAAQPESIWSNWFVTQIEQHPDVLARKGQEIELAIRGIEGARDVAMEQIAGEAQLALIGGIVALFVSGQYLSVPSSICFITLFGVAVLNGVMMVEAINLRIESSNKEITKAIFEGAVSRLRPVLMTGTVTALGLTPMVLSNGIGSDIQRPLATVIVGGLVTAAFLTLFVLPVLYAWFSKGKLTEIRTR